jgi:hypothetical protein
VPKQQQALQEQLCMQLFDATGKQQMHAGTAVMPRAAGPLTAAQARVTVIGMGESSMRSTAAGV